MIPLLPFIAGLVAGAGALSILRSERTRQTLHEASQRLRTAAQTAEERVRSVTRSGQAVWHGATQSPADETPDVEEIAKAAAPPKKKVVRKRVSEKTEEAKPVAAKRAPRKAKSTEAQT